MRGYGIRFRERVEARKSGGRTATSGARPDPDLSALSPLISCGVCGDDNHNVSLQQHVRAQNSQTASRLILTVFYLIILSTRQ